MSPFEFIPNLMFMIVPLLFFIIFIIVIGRLIYDGVSTLKYKSQPVIPVEAVVVAKRTVVRGRGNNHHTYTSYFVTFEFMNRERMEFKVPDEQFGYLIEGDRGILSFQGKLYVGFKRS